MCGFKLSSRDVAFMAVFAALSAIVCRVIPGMPVIGVSGSNIKFDAVLAPIYGLIIGPYLGFLAGLIGGVLVADSPLSIYTSFCTAISAMVAGFLTQKSHSSQWYGFKGWMMAASVVGLLILGWYATWVGQQAVFYPVLQFTGLIAILVARERIASAFEKSDEKVRYDWKVKPNYIFCGILTIVLAYIFSKTYLDSIWWFFPYLSLPSYFIGGIIILYGLIGHWIKERVVAAVAVASYCGIVADHMLGNLIYIEIFGLPPSLFMEVLPVSIVERFLFTAIATLFGVGLVFALRSAGLFPQRP